MSKAKASEALNVQLPVIQLALDKILVDESRNLRRFNPDAKKVEELANSIRDNGLINPVLVRPLPEPYEGCTHVLVAGYQRMKAIGYLNEHGHKVDEVSASVKDVDESVDDTVNARRFKLLNLKENFDRSEISYIDCAFAIKELLEAGMTATDIAKEFKKSGAWVSYVSKLVTLRAHIQKAIHEGKIPFKLARTLPDLTEEEQDKALADLEAGMGASDAAGKAKAGKKRKNKRGRKAKEDQSEGKNLSSKQAILQLEELITSIETVEEGEKVTKADAAVVDLVKDVVKFLKGKVGVKALHNRLVKVV